MKYSLFCASFFLLIFDLIPSMIQKFFSITITIILSAAIFADEIKVCSNCEHSSIKEAVLSAQSGDTIIVEKGIYNEHDIVIDKPLTLLGQEQPVIDAQSKGYLFKINSDSVTLKGFKLTNVPISYTTEYAAVYTFKVNNFHFEDNTLENTFFGFLIEKSHNGVIKNNIIKGNAVKEHSSGNGIHLWHSSKVRIINNNIERMRDGIYFEFVKHSVIRDNESHCNLRYGLHFMFSNDDRYENNLFEKNGAGVAVMFSKNIYMKNNIFRLNWGTASYGLLLKEINDADIISNTFEQNTIGINAEGSNRVVYEQNNFKSNGWAIRFLGACYGNKFIRNNFMNNALDISYKGSMNGNIFDRNYWSSYSGYDLNKDNLGDVPYRPVKLFSYVVNQTPETIILLRSLFVDIINFSEKVSPVFTPDNLKDLNPLMKPVGN